jgi:hypothetical protein
MFSSRCRGLILLETYTTSRGDIELPKFLNVVKEVTSDPEYSMFNLSSLTGKEQLTGVDVCQCHQDH